MVREVLYQYQNTMLNYAVNNEEAVARIKDINEQIQEENVKEVADNSKLTKLMFEQMLRGLYINNIN